MLFGDFLVTESYLMTTLLKYYYHELALSYSSKHTILLPLCLLEWTKDGFAALVRDLSKKNLAKEIGCRQKGLEYLLVFPLHDKVSLMTRPCFICITGNHVNAFVHGTQIYQLHSNDYQHKGILVSIDTYFGDYSLSSIVIPYTKYLSLWPDPTVQKI